jgi:hypothetical protein
MAGHVPTSVLLNDLLTEAPPDHVTLGWILMRLDERSFGLLMLLLALFALMPGLSTFIGIVLTVPAVQMILARHSPVLPRFVAERRVRTERLAWLIRRTLPVLRWLERLIRPRWPTPFETTKRVVGGIILLLSLTLVGPIPLSHIIPSLTIMLVAVAYLEEDGVMLCIALAVAVSSLAVTAATVWATVEGIEFIDRLS